MKGKLRIASLFAGTFLAVSAMAVPGSSLRLLLPNTGEHTVIIDNVPYRNVYERFRMDQLRPGNHRLKVVSLFVSPRGRVLERRVIYNGAVFIPGNAKVWARVGRNGRLVIERTYQYERGRGYYDGDHRRERRDYDRNRYHYDEYYDEDWYGYNEGGSREEYAGNASRDNDFNRSRDGRDYRNEERYESDRESDQQFSNTLNAIRKQSFDTERLKIAKNAVASGSYNSREISEITRLFSFESTRLEFAKFAYRYTTDPKNYVLVQDAFTFSSSVSELQDYITQNGNR